MKSPLEVAVFRVHCASQILHDASREKPVGLEEWQTMTASMAQLSHCCAMIASAITSKTKQGMEIEETMMEPGVLPEQYSKAIDEAMRELG